MNVSNFADCNRPRPRRHNGTYIRYKVTGSDERYASRAVSNNPGKWIG